MRALHPTVHAGAALHNLPKDGQDALGESPVDNRFEAVRDVLETYFDGLYASDTAKLAQVFHPKAVYVCASEGDFVHLDMEAYFAAVDQRSSPASSEPLNGRIVSIEFAGPATASARVTCSIHPKDFTDLLTLVLTDGRGTSEPALRRSQKLTRRPDPRTTFGRKVRQGEQGRWRSRRALPSCTMK